MIFRKRVHIYRVLIFYNLHGNISEACTKFQLLPFLLICNRYFGHSVELAATLSSAHGLDSSTLTPKPNYQPETKNLQLFKCILRFDILAYIIASV